MDSHFYKWAPEGAEASVFAFGLSLVINQYLTTSLQCFLSFVFLMSKMSLLRSAPYINMPLLLEEQEFSLKPHVLSFYCLGYGSNDSLSSAFCSWAGSAEMKPLHCQRHMSMQTWAPFTHTSWPHHKRGQAGWSPAWRQQLGAGSNCPWSLGDLTGQIALLRPKARLANG